MKVLVNQENKLKTKFLKYLLRLPSEQMMGVVKILGVKLEKEEQEEEKEMTEMRKIVKKLGTNLEEEKENKENSKEVEVKAEEKEEENKKNSKDAIDVLAECIDNFSKLPIAKKKEILGIMKAAI